MRIGLGIDAHAFAPADARRHLVLGGVQVPYERGLAGHSDADVLTHAIADAVLGALRAGDIGKHFPDTDPVYKDVVSLTLLRQVGELAQAQGFTVKDVDSVIIAQEPKLAPYREEMRANLAAALGISVEQVGVKATTTEWLGFEGRREGISAHAVALLEKTEQTGGRELRGAISTPEVALVERSEQAG